MQQKIEIHRINFFKKTLFEVFVLSLFLYFGLFNTVNGQTQTIGDGCVEDAEASLYSSLPSTLFAGQNYNFTINYRNVGTTWWYHNGWSWNDMSMYQLHQKNSFTLGLAADDMGSVNTPPTAPPGYGGGAWGSRTIT